MQNVYLESIAHETKRKGTSATVMLTIDIDVTDRDLGKPEYRQRELSFNRNARMHAPKNDKFGNTPSDGERIAGRLKMEYGVSSPQANRREK